MPAVPIKPEYGPTLGRLLAPRWNAASPLARRFLLAVGATLVVVIVAAVLTLENAHYSHGGRVPFSFSYRGLYRVAPDPGGFVKVERRFADGTVHDSFAVGPLRLPPYSGNISGELPLYAAAYIRELSGRFSGFALRGEGKTKVNTLTSAYHVLYSVLLGGRKLYGRDVLLVPERPGARDGVVIEMLSFPMKSSESSSPLEVALKGVLLRPLKTFTFG